MNQRPIYRRGAVGALMDEYERAASELRRFVEHLSEDEFTRIVDSLTSNANCRSAQTIMSHVVSAGYGYASAIRGAFSIDPDRPPKRMLTHTEELEELDAMLEYTRRTLDDRCEMSEADIRGTAIQSRWGVWYDLEQLLEHAIVHVLRHRRQIEKLLNPDSRQVAAADARSVRPRKKGSPLTEFLDRLDASRYAHDEGVSIGTAEPGGEPNWTLSIPERLFSRAHQIASAYELHLLAAIDYNDRVRLVTSQVETLSLELAFVRERIVDPLLAQHLESLAKLAESCLRSDRTKELVLEGP